MGVVHLLVRGLDNTLFRVGAAILQVLQPKLTRLSATQLLKVCDDVLHVFCSNATVAHVAIMFDIADILWL